MSLSNGLAIMNNAYSFLKFEENQQVLREHVTKIEANEGNCIALRTGKPALETTHTIREQEIKVIYSQEPRVVFICLGDGDVLDAKQVIEA